MRGWSCIQSVVLRLLILCNAIAAQVPDRCEGCWCITNADGTTPNASCPPYGQDVGIFDSLSSEAYTAYKSFQLVTPVLNLQPPNGGATCYPFRDKMGIISSFAESGAPQCVRPTITDSMVCAFKHERTNDVVAQNLDQECLGRNYSLVEYPSAEAAVNDGAVVTHTGNCGVCSNAYDFAIRLERDDTFQTATTLCGVSFFLSRTPDRFEGLIDCLANPDNIGFTRPCATLWAYYSATNAYNCSAACSRGFSEDVPLNKNEMGCPFSDCLACAEDVFQVDMNLFSGRTLPNSGIVEDSARTCSAFSNVFHDPCPGQDITLFPTAAPVSSSTKRWSWAFSACAVVFGVVQWGT